MTGRRGELEGVSWNTAEPGVFVLPGGRVVRGRGLSTPPNLRPDWGLYATLRDPGPGWRYRWVCWPDFWLPLNGRDARDAICQAWELSANERVEVACGGGVGRTGTVLSALAMLDGLDADEAVAWVRERYHPRAVETPWQRRWLERNPPRRG